MSFKYCNKTKAITFKFKIFSLNFNNLKPYFERILVYIHRFLAMKNINNTLLFFCTKNYTFLRNDKKIFPISNNYNPILYPLGHRNTENVYGL